MDIIISLILVLLFSPLMIAAAIMIKLASPGPVFADAPPRAGKDGVPFKMFKFRSMIKNAQRELETNPKFATLYIEYKRNNFKIDSDKDPRITKFGRFIRKYSIDELPQLFNVLQGEMSFVGPRAYYPSELREQQCSYPHTKEYINKALSVKPGITGLWQVSGRASINFEKRIELDAMYATKQSLWLDIRIIFKTPLAVILAKGAY